MNASVTKPEVSIVMVPYNNEKAVTTRLVRDLIPTVDAHRDWKFEIIIVDNSIKAQKVPLGLLTTLPIRFHYEWTGRNLYYGPAMNVAMSYVQYPYTLYVCSSHGRMYDPTWIDDLLQPLLDNPSVAKSGTLAWSPIPNKYGVRNIGQPNYHVQGGIFMARSEVMKKVPYPENRYRHYGSDINQDYRILLAGHDLADVPTIRSIWRHVIKAGHNMKYIHDSSEDEEYNYQHIKIEDVLCVPPQRWAVENTKVVQIKPAIIGKK